MTDSELKRLMKLARAAGKREMAEKLVQVLSDLHNAWEFEVKTEKQFDGLMHAAIKRAVKERDALLASRAGEGAEG